MAAAAGAALGTAPAGASLTLWPTCSSPPGGDYALCAKGAFPQSVLPGPDGAVWFTTARANLGRVTTAGGVSQYDVPVLTPAGGGGLLGGLALGPDGAFWFPQFGLSGLWRGSATGPPVFSYSDGGPADTQPRDAALGPDGALWTAEAKTDSVGRLALGGAFTHIPLPPKPAGTFVSSLAICSGPDGRLWVARPRSIAAITTAGIVTSYPVPGNDPEAIAVGPDGAVWFTMYGTDRVGRITTTGAVTLFDLPSGAAPASITTGPDGALWIGLGKDQGIMRMTTSGAWTVTPLLFSSQVSSITTGADGAIWFGDLAGSRIGRLDGVAPASGPSVTSLIPAFAAAGATVAVTGTGLGGASAVTVGGLKAAFKATARGLDVTIPAGAGAAPLRVSARGATSPPTDAATFTYATAGASQPAPPAQPAAAPTVDLGSARLSPDGTLTVSVATSVAAPFDIVAGLPLSGKRARIAGRPKLTIPRAGKAKGRFTRAGRTSVRVHLGRSALRTVRRGGRRGARVEVGVRIGLGGGQTSVGQRTYRLVLR